MTYFNEFGQARLGWRTGGGGITPSTLWNSIYAVYNADSTGSSSLTTSLVSAYNGESNANDSFGSNNGTAMGGLTYTTGKIGNAFQFNGTTSYVSLPNNSLNFTGDFSVSFWVYLTNISSSNLGLVTNFNNGAGNSGWTIGTITSGNLYFGTYNISNQENTTPITINTWNHVVCTFKKNNTKKIYINGTLVLTESSPLSPTYSPTHYPSIGASTYSPVLTQQYLPNGSKLDATNIWQKELTQSEITELYNSGNGAQYITDNFYKPTANDALNTYNGTAQGGLTYGVGKVGTAFQFNGQNAYVSLPNNSLNLTGDFSISFWYYPNAVGVEKYLISNYNSNASGGHANGTGFIVAIQTNNTIGMAIYNTGYATCYSTATLTANTWYHVTITRKAGTNTKVYVNGNLSQTVTSTKDPVYPQATYQSTIGQAPGFGGFVNGNMDGINFWQKELSATEITELYNSGNGKQYPN